MTTGQSSTEMFMVIAVLVIALVFVANALIPGLGDGVRGLSEDVQTVYTNVTSDGSDEMR